MLYVHPMLKSDMNLLLGLLIRSSRRIGRRCMHMCGRRGACTPTSILQLVSSLPSLPSLSYTSLLSGIYTHPSRANYNLKYRSEPLRTPVCAPRVTVKGISVCLQRSQGLPCAFSLLTALFPSASFDTLCPDTPPSPPRRTLAPACISAFQTQSS